MSHDDFLKMQMELGRSITPLFTVPGVTTAVFRRDWLHCADQGVAADFLGNLFHECAEKLPGATDKIRCRALWLKIKAFYAANKVQDKLIGLRPGGFRQKGKSPKLRGNAACCRALIPFGHQIAMELLDSTYAPHQAMQIAALKLLECYNCLTKSSADWTEVLPEASKDFAIQYHALSLLNEGTVNWVVKPKMHQFLEMCCSGSKPNMSWCYRDEDYGGSIAQLCRIKGGCWNRPVHYSRKMLSLFKTKNKVPRIV